MQIEQLPSISLRLPWSFLRKYGDLLQIRSAWTVNRRLDSPRKILAILLPKLYLVRKEIDDVAATLTTV